MKKTISILAIGVSLFVLSGCANSNSSESSMTKEKKNMSHIHMKHVSTKWNDTPNQVGFLAILKDEANTAQFHSKLLMKQPKNLKWIKTHTKHIRHAIKASSEKKGPGKSYGVYKSAMGVTKHINLAANSKGASKNIKIHASHISTSSSNITTWSEEIISLSDIILETTNPITASKASSKINTLINSILNGTDTNNDGKVTWVKNEGGINQIQKHLMLMKKGEGIM